MKKKLILATTSLMFLTTSSPFLFSSCKTTNTDFDSDDVIILNNKSITAYERLVSEQFWVNDECLSSTVFIEISNKSSPLFDVSDNLVTLDNQKRGLVKFSIDDSVDENILFTCDLTFWYRKLDNKFYQFTIPDIAIYYLTQHFDETDKIELLNVTSEKENNHIFDYKFKITGKPTSQTLVASLVNASSPKISLVNNEVNIEKEGIYYYATVKIKLDLSVFQSSVFSFDLDVQFFNSHLWRQTNHFYGLTARFSKVYKEEIPSEYYNIEHTDEGDVLLGLYPEVSKLEAGAYSRMIIPDNVTKISNNAFTDANWFSNVRFIHIPSTVQTIEKNAFVGLGNLYEIDLQDFEKIPPWFNQTEIFGDGSQFQTIGGFIWVNDKVSDRIDLITKYIEKWGLKESWSPYPSSNVSNINDFVISSDGKNIVGINTTTATAIERWKKIEVVRIPDNIEKINDNAFEKLVQYPCNHRVINDSASDHLNGELPYQTRRLILGRKLTSLPGSAFANSGIGGTILIWCENLVTLPSACFWNTSSYGYDDLPGQVYKEKPRIFLCDTFNLSIVEDYCFNMTPLENKELVFPDSVQSIGQFAFQGHQFETIKFTSNINNVGLWSFSNMYSHPSSPTITSIDLSCYKNIINPGAKPKDWTTIPEWMKSKDLAFELACVEGEDHFVYVSQALYEEVEKSQDGLEKWEKNFLQNHGIPSSWKLKVKED